jgi:hypothetical protein
MIKSTTFSQHKSTTAIFLLLLVIPLALFTGVLTASGNLQIDVLWIAALSGIGLLALSGDILIWSIAILALLVVGQLMYFLGLNQAVWIPYGLGLLLFLRAPVAYANSALSRLHLSPSLTLPVFIFIGFVILSMIINASPLTQALRATKSYIFLWGIFLLIAYWGVKLETLNRIFKFCIVVAFIQLPLVLYQYLIIAPKRSNLGGIHGVSWDAIVGGFGGDPMGGGASGTMAWFLVFVTVLSIALHRRNMLRKMSLAAVITTSLVCIGLAEVKVVVILLPLAMGALFIPYIKQNPIKALLAFILSIMAGIAILILYSDLHSEKAGGGSLNFDVIAVLYDSFWYSLDPSFINFSTGEMGRFASIAHWWHENGLNDPIHTLFGHGPGSSGTSSVFGSGEVARKYPFDINRSTLSIFLWDIGLVGVFSYLTIIVQGMILALKESRRPTITPIQAATLEAIFGGLSMIIIMLPYGKDVTEVPALGMLIMLFLGYVSLINSNHKAAIKLTRKHHNA